jgi:hypothetical protein
VKLYEIERQEDGSVKIESEITAEEMKALLHIGYMACIQQGVMIASIAERMGMVDPSDDGAVQVDVSGDEFLNQFDGITYESEKDGN